MFLRTLLAALLLGSAVAAQTPLSIPPFGNTFASASATRGFWFQTPVALTITGLRVPDEAAIGVQCVEVLELGAAPPVYPLTATGTRRFHATNVTSAQILPCNLTFAAGAWIGVLGACGTTTMNNSYSGPIGGSFATTIAGQPVQLMQLLSQTNLTAAGSHPYSGYAQGLGQIGRIEVFYSVPPLPTSIAVPSFFQTNSSAASTRGLQFTAPVPMVIRGLRVPDEANAGVQNVEVVRLAAAPPQAPATATGGSAFYANNVPSHLIVPCNIVVAAGERIGILGACGTTTMRNSMADPAGPFASSIGGQPVTLERFVTPSNLNSSSGQPYSSDPNTRMGRVEVYYELPTGLATATNYGAGCKDGSRGFYQYSPSGLTTLTGFSMRLTETGNHYDVEMGQSYATPPTSATVLMMGDDDQVPLPLSSPFHHFGTPTALYVCSNGYVSTGLQNSVVPNIGGAAWFAGWNARWGTWHDFNPTFPFLGYIKYHEAGAWSVVTWDGVKDWSMQQNWFQLRFHRTTGEVQCAWWYYMGSGPFLVGYSPGTGNGMARNRGSMDLHAALLGNGFSTQEFDQAPLTLAASQRPVLGTTVQFAVGDVTPGSAIGLMVFGLAGDNTPLAGLGAPGCSLYVQSVVNTPFAVAGSSGSSTLSIPANGSLVGVHVFAQAVTWSPGQNALDLVFSNGLDLGLDLN